MYNVRRVPLIGALYLHWSVHVTIVNCTKRYKLLKIVDLRGEIDPFLTFFEYLQTTIAKAFPGKIW